MRKFISAGMLAIAIALSGCATLGNGKIDISPQTQVLVKAVIQIAVYRAIGTDPAKAIRIAQIASQAIGYAEAGVSDSTITAAYIEDAVRDNVEWEKLTLEERAVADSLIELVRIEIDELIGGKQLDSDTVIRVVSLLTWVRDTAERAANDPVLNPAPVSQPADTGGAEFGPAGK